MERTLTKAWKVASQTLTALFLVPTLVSEADGQATVDLIWDSTGTPDVEVTSGPQFLDLSVYITAGPDNITSFGLSVDYSGLLGIIIGPPGFGNAPDGIAPFLFSIGSPSDSGTQINNFSAAAIVPALFFGQTFRAGIIEFVVDPPVGCVDVFPLIADGGTEGIINGLGQDISGFSTFNSAFICGASISSGCPDVPDMDCNTGFEKGFLLVKEELGKEKLIAKFLKGPAGVQADFGNPLIPDGTAVDLCIYDDQPQLVGTLQVDRAGDTCGTGDCWKPTGGEPPDGKGYKYKDNAGDADGVQKLLYTGGETGKLKALVKGKGANLPTGIPLALQSTMNATLQLRASDGMCWSVTVSDIKKQEADFFKAK